MTSFRTSLFASQIALWTGVLWGVYWLPVRALEEHGLGGAWGTVAIALAAALVLLPFVVFRMSRLGSMHRLAVASVALGGLSFALYSVGFLYGRVAIIALLWFLSPIWSVLIGRYLMGWAVTPLRLLAIVVGLAGLAAVLGARGEMPLPQDLGEWMSLVGGILWSFSTTGIRVSPKLDLAVSSFIFAISAALTALALAPFLQPFPNVTGEAAMIAIGLAFLTGALWWALSMAALIWATMRIEPARVSILLMTEVPVSAITAAWLAHESLNSIEIAGGALVLVAGVLEVFSSEKKA